MRLRKLLIATGALAAAGALVLAPTAQATNPTGTNINVVTVGWNPASFAYPVTLPMKSGQLQVAVYGIPTTANCTSGAGAGTIKGGPHLPSVATEVITSLALTCPSYFPGTTVTVAMTCGLEVVFSDPNVHPLLFDVGVPGTSKFSAVDGTLYLSQRSNPLSHCLHFSMSNGCQFSVGGSTAVQFDEAEKLVGGQKHQDLHILGGPGLLVKNPNGSCMGAFPNNTPFKITATFNHYIAAGTVDFQ